MLVLVRGKHEALNGSSLISPSTISGTSATVTPP